MDKRKDNLTDLTTALSDTQVAKPTESKPTPQPQVNQVTTGDGEIITLDNSTDNKVNK